MTDFRAYLDNPRWRNLAILGATAFVMIVLAVLGLWHQAGLTGHREEERPFFPGLLARVDQVAEIRIRTSKGTLDVAFKPEKTWVVSSHDDYRASFDQVRQTVIGMATLTTLEKKTARKDWFSYIGLGSPNNGGAGTEITLLDDKGAVMASLIAGKTVDIGDANGAVGLFARRAGEDQSWLLRSFFEPKSDAGDWLDKKLMQIDRARISEADVDPASGPSYVLRRDKPTDADFNLVDVPKGREIAYPGSPDGVAAAVVDFSFDDVKPAKDFDFSDPAHTARLVTRTFDGLTITVNVVQQAQAYWATVSAEGMNADSQKEARDIDARASGWAYKLPAYKAQQFVTPLESLLKPKGGAAPAPQSQ